MTLWKPRRSCDLMCGFRLAKLSRQSACSGVLLTHTAVSRAVVYACTGCRWSSLIAERLEHDARLPYRRSQTSIEMVCCLRKLKASRPHPIHAALTTRGREPARADLRYSPANSWRRRQMWVRPT